MKYVALYQPGDYDLKVDTGGNLNQLRKVVKAITKEIEKWEAKEVKAADRAEAAKRKKVR